MRKATPIIALVFASFNAEAGIFVGPPPMRLDDAADHRARQAAPCSSPMAVLWSALMPAWDSAGEGVRSTDPWTLLRHFLTTSTTCSGS